MSLAKIKNILPKGKVNLPKIKALGNIMTNNIKNIKFTKPTKKPEVPKITEDFNYLNQINFIGNYLNYKSYQNDIFINDGSFGFCLYANPLTGASEQLANRLMGMFSLRWPQESTLSFMLYSSKELKLRMDSWLDKRKNAHPLIREMARARANFITNGINSSLVQDEKLLVRDYRLVISVTFNGKLTDKNKTEINLFKKQFYSSLDNLGFNPKPIDPNMLLDLVDELFNRKEGFRDMNYQYNPYTEIRQQVSGPSTRVLTDKDGFSLNNTIVRGVAIQEYPTQNPLAESLDLIGDMIDDITQLSSQFLYCTNIWIPDKSKIKTTVNAKSARAIQNSESPMAKWVPDFATKAADWREVQKMLADGQSLFYINQAFFTFAELGKSNFAENDLIDVFRNKGWNVVPASFIEYPLFLSCLPMQFDNNRYETLKRLKLTRLLPAWNVVNLLIAFGEWAGNSYDHGMMLLGRRGQQSILNIFSSNGNYNVAIAADSGSGKSFFMNDLIFAYLGLGAKIYVIDVGRSYLKLCELFDGQYISFGKDEENVCMNPFSYIDKGDVEDIQDGLTLIRNLIGIAINPDGLTNLEKMYIGTAVKEAYNQKNNQACFDDVYQILMANAKEEVRNLGIQLQDYSRDGAYSRYFNGPANVEFKKQFIILELEELNQKKELRNVIMNLLMVRVSQDMYLTPKNVLKICAIDEAWDIMKGGTSTQEFITTGYRRARKYNGSFITITQRIQDYYENEGATACLVNSQWTFMLKQNEEAVEQLQDDKKLSLSPYQMEIIKSIKTKKGVYSEIFIKSDGIGTPVRLIVDPFSSLVYTTDPADFQLIEDFKAQGYSIEQAIHKVLEYKQQNYNS